MSGSFYSNIHELGIAIIYASSLHILMEILIDMNVNYVLLLWKNKQKKTIIMNNAEKSCLMKMMISCF